MSLQYPKKDKKSYKPNKFIRFTSAGLQMGLTVWLGNELGKWIDLKYQKEIYETIITLCAVFIAMFLVIKQAIKISKDA